MSAASVIMAAGRGSRMEGFKGNKTLLPLAPGDSPYEGDHPILLQALMALPPGPKALVVHHRKEDVMKATGHLGLTYCVQNKLNGTGGALLAARNFLESQHNDQVVITMGDVPFVRTETYEAMLGLLERYSLVVLGFAPKAKKNYGLLEIEADRVKRIVEWKYWKDYPENIQTKLRICNSGIYTARTEELLRYLTLLASRPHIVKKEIGGKLQEIEEFFVTDIVEYMHGDGLHVGYLLTKEEEVMGVDDLPGLLKAQKVYREKLF